jgi:hypothetical protein
VRQSFLRGDKNFFVQASLINGLANPEERIELPLAALALLKDGMNSLLDQLAEALVLAAGKLPLDLLLEVR